MVQRPDLDGLRLRMPGNDTVWMMDQGKKRGIPSVQVYNELFSTWDNIHLDLNVDGIDTGSSLSSTACLFRCFDSGKVFLLDGTSPNFIKRHIASPDVMSRFQFSWNKVHVWNVSINVLQFPDGPAITKTGRPD
jgi:hypothetical protein